MRSKLVEIHAKKTKPVHRFTVPIGSQWIWSGLRKSRQVCEFRAKLHGKAPPMSRGTLSLSLLGWEIATINSTALTTGVRLRFTGLYVAGGEFIEVRFTSNHQAADDRLALVDCSLYTKA